MTAGYLTPRPSADDNQKTWDTMHRVAPEFQLPTMIPWATPANWPELSSVAELKPVSRIYLRKTVAAVNE